MTTLAPPLTREQFGHLPDGRPIERIRLAGAGGFEARLLTFGATLQALRVPDAAGRVADVILGHDTPGPYQARRDFFGVTVGRFANRIAGATFDLDGIRHPLDANEGTSTLHGGPAGFDRVLWDVVSVEDGAAPGVTLAHTSPDGAGGFPGTLAARVTFALTGPAELTIRFEATTDRPTVVSLTNHAFFNLDGAGDILGHRLMIPADGFLAVGPDLIPLAGPPRPVAGTPFDFRAATEIGARIRDDDPQIRIARGYDHCFCLAPAPTEVPRLAARLEAARSGRVLELLTDQPGLQLYSGNFLDGAGPGKGGRLHRQSDALCLEPEAWPDAPNRPDFPSARLTPSETYRHTSIYRFSAIQPKEFPR